MVAARSGLSDTCGPRSFARDCSMVAARSGLGDTSDHPLVAKLVFVALVAI